MKDLPAQGSFVICTNEEQERIGYEIQPHIDGATQYRRIAPCLPMHFIFGARQDVM
jgi:hypothetical protein